MPARDQAIARRTSDAIGGEPVGIDSQRASTCGEERGWVDQVEPARTGVGGRWASTDHGRSPGSRARGTSGRGGTGAGIRPSAASFRSKSTRKEKVGRRHGGRIRAGDGSTNLGGSGRQSIQAGTGDQSRNDLGSRVRDVSGVTSARGRNRHRMTHIQAVQTFPARRHDGTHSSGSTEQS